jgi:small-conductance mechanosensitive channel
MSAFFVLAIALGAPAQLDAGVPASAGRGSNASVVATSNAAPGSHVDAGTAPAPIGTGTAPAANGTAPAANGTAPAANGATAGAHGDGASAQAGTATASGSRSPEAGAAHVDAGTPHEAPDVIAATVHDRPSPLRFRGADARRRANDAGTALTAALEAEAIEGAPLASVRVQDGLAVVEVRGRSVATFTQADADSENTTLARYAPELETRLISFVKDEQRRSSLQALALRLFFSVLLGVVALVTLRALRGAFSRWDQKLDDAQLAPLQFLGQTILSSDALRGLLAVALVAARIVSYVGIVAVVLGAVLGQFELTRPLLARLGGWAAAPLLSAIDAFVGAVPGLVLAALLVVALRAAFRFVKVLLDGVAEGRVSSGIVAPGHAFPARVAATAALALTAAPVIVAAAFGRFGTPLETLALAAGGVTLLASLPILASTVAGVVVLWRGALKPGDWVEVKGHRGEVVSVHLLDVVIVPEDGGTVRIPHLAFATAPLRHAPRAPHASLELVVRRDRAVDKIERALLDAARTVSVDASVSFVSLDAASIRVLLACPTKPGAKDALVRAIAAASEAGDIALA